MDSSPNTISFVVKNHQRGLSQTFYDQKHSRFELTGPQGKGLGLTKESKGVYLAFAAGTGVIVFVDLLVNLFLGNINP